jgi:hypothetical protein
MLKTAKLACPKCATRHQLRTEFLGNNLICVQCRHSFRPHVVISCALCQGGFRVGLEKLGQDVSCEHCGERFLAEIRTQCPFCANPLKILPEFIGHQVTCKKCKQSICAALTEERIVVSPISPENRSEQVDVQEGILERLANSACITEFGIATAVAEEPPTQDPMNSHRETGNSSQETLVEALVLREPIADRSAECEELRVQLTLLQTRASRTEEFQEALQTLEAQQGLIAHLQAQLASLQIVKEEADAPRLREIELADLQKERACWKEEFEKVRQKMETSTLHCERLSRSVSALELAQAEHEQMRGVSNAIRQDAEALRIRVIELKRLLADANNARADEEAANARVLEEARSRADAELRAQQSQWELKQENLLREKGELRTLVARLEADRERLQLQSDTLLRQSGEDRKLLEDEAHRLREQAARLALERDIALERMDQSQLTAHAEVASRAIREAEDRLQPEIVSLKQALEETRKQGKDTARRLFEVSGDLSAARKEGEMQRQIQQEQTQELVALEQKLRFAQAEMEKEKKQSSAITLESAKECAALKAEVQRLSEANAVLRDERDGLISGCRQGDQYREELLNQRQNLGARLEEEKLRVTALYQELGSTRLNAELEQKRLTELWAEERTRVQTEKREGQNRLTAALQGFDQERKAMQGELEKAQQEVDSLKLERDNLLGQLTKQRSELALQCDHLKASRQEMENRWRNEVTSLNQAALHAQRDLQVLRTEADQHHRREADRLSELNALRQERDSAQHDAADARKDLNDLREAFEQERLRLTGELENLRQQLVDSDSGRTALGAAGPQSAAAGAPVIAGRFERTLTNFEMRVPAELTRLGEFAKKIETLEAELDRQSSARSETWRQHRALAAIGGSLRHLWGRSAMGIEESPNDDPPPERRLRALWTEVMSERERILHQTANKIRADLEQQLTELRAQLATTQERAVQPEATRGLATVQEG